MPKGFLNTPLTMVYVLLTAENCAFLEHSRTARDRANSSMFSPEISAVKTAPIQLVVPVPGCATMIQK